MDTNTNYGVYTGVSEITFVQAPNPSIDALFGACMP